MQALIPFSLTECLAPREVGALLTIAETENRPVEDIVVFALRDFLVSRTTVKPTLEAHAEMAAKAA
jgi:hypothetical protein